MYSPNIESDQVERLYRLKCEIMVDGKERTTMTELVREALEKYLPVKEREVVQKLKAKGIFLIKSQPLENSLNGKEVKNK